MNFNDVKNFDEYSRQKLNVELADAIAVSSEAILHPENIKNYVEILGKIIGEFVSKQGYKPSEKTKIMIKVPSIGGTADPCNSRGTVGGKVDCNLTATKDQYVFYASEIIDELKGECKRQIEKTWKDRLTEDLTSSFYKEHPYMEDEEWELEKEFIKKKDRMIAKIQTLVEKFEVSQKEERLT